MNLKQLKSKAREFGQRIADAVDLSEGQYAALTIIVTLATLVLIAFAPAHSVVVPFLIVFSVVSVVMWFHMLTREAAYDDTGFFDTFMDIDDDPEFLRLVERMEARDGWQTTSQFELEQLNKYSSQFADTVPANEEK